ncbi:alpha/beta fold hydrolase [Nocardia panacis]|uniref:alpha/beta fold hydrolase n=1 Tax=Nocardia panacis TaxID=2340916 RepID=UPI001EEFA452|nr:alpha/beta hydrolase [Nocardia panacis]
MAVIYDRRGRGESGDNSRNYVVEDEIADLAAVIAHVGGRAGVFGHSSGGVLALEAAMRGLPIDRVAVYEATYISDDSRPLPAADVPDRVRALIALGDRDGATALFLTEQVGVPPEMVAGMQAAPVWSFMSAQADSLPYDMAVCGPQLTFPSDRLARISVPSLIIAGQLGEPWIRATAAELGDTIPHADHRTIPGQDHSILHQPDALAPSLLDFFTAD